jgi:hypothetical protein
MKIRRGIKMMFIILIALILPASATYAQTYFSSTDTLVTCQKYLYMKESAPDIAGAYDLWVFGYVSGLNISNYHTKKVDLLSAQTTSDLLRAIKAFCSVEPTSKKTLKEAVDNYWGALSAKQGE